MKSEITSMMLADLNERFNVFGVYIEHVVITSVKVPEELKYNLSATTTYDAILLNQIKQHENGKIKKNNEENSKLAGMKKEH